MTPKEKAEELVTKFIQYVPADESMELPYAKKCTLIAVNEIIEQLNHLPTQGYGMEYQDIIKYWQEVKNEINLL